MSAQNTTGMYFFIRFSPIWLLLAVSAVAQPPMQRDFLGFQRSFKRVDEAFAKTESRLQAEFEAKGLEWPARFMYIRSFKFDSRLEIWVKNKANEAYKPFKAYKVCALAGNLGPKRFEGDYQVPEGFYYINAFKPNSQYHLALGVNYPNASDRILSDKKRPGGEIYIHGSCVTVGCIPLTDPIIEEVYVLAASTRAAGQDFIPLHVFPVFFKRDKSKEILDEYLKVNPDYKPLAMNLERAFYYFQEKKQLPTIVITGKGEYTMLQEFAIPKRPPPPPPPPPPFKENTAVRKKGKFENITEEELRAFVNSHPVFPGGNEAFKAFVDKLGAELTEFMPEEKQRIFAKLEFVVNKQGKVVNVTVDGQVNNEMNNLIIERFEALPAWTPALIKDKPMPKRLSQSIMVNAKPKAPEAPKMVPSDYEDEIW